MAGTANSITSHNSLRGVLNANNVIAGGVGTAFDSTYSIIAETGAQIALSISSTDYKMQATLKDKYGNIIYTSNIIDLPLETMVVNARYDKNTKEVVLILDNGNELRFSVADLVEGLVSTDQLNSALTDYVKNTDYATNSKGGVVNANVNGFNIGSTGNPYALELTYANYQQYGGGSFVGKGTLENVIAGKELVNKTYVDEADAVFEDKLFGNNNVEGSGTELTINNTTEAPMNLVYKGNTSQDSISGKNLANIYAIPNFSGTSFKRTVANETITIWDNTNMAGYSTTERKLSAICPNLQVGDTAILTFNTTFTAAKYIYLNGTNNTWGNGTTRTITQSDLDSTIVLYGGYNQTTVISEFMIRKSSITDTTYEPYTGGIVSPNLEYPQQVHVVSGDNNIEVCGKNLFDGTPFVSCNSGQGYINKLNGQVTIISSDNNNVTFKVDYAYGGLESNYIPVKANETYTLNLEGTNIGNRFFITQYDNSKTRISTLNNVSIFSFPLTFTTTNNGYITIANTNTSVPSSNCILKNIQLEKGTQVTTYEEYKSASYPINLGVENLFDKDNITRSYRVSQLGVDYFDSDYYISSFIKVNHNTTYTKNSPITDAYHRVAFYQSNSISSFISVKDDDNTFTTPANCQYIRFCGLQTELDTTILTIGNHIQQITNIPIELCKIGTYQDKIDKSTGRNLCGYNNSLPYTSSGVTLSRENNNYKISGTLNGWFWKTIYTIPANTLDGSYLFKKITFSGTSSVGFRVVDRTISPAVTYVETFNQKVADIPKNHNDLLVEVVSATSTQTLDETFNILIQKSSEINQDYEPYGTGWYLKKEIGKVVLDGSENWKLYTGTCYFINITNAKSGYQTSKCSHFININMAFDSGIVGRYCDHPTLTNKYFVSNSSSVEDFKTWLSNNNTTLYYILATPIYEEITDEILIDQLEAIKLSYEEQTNISQTNNDLPFELNISAVSGNLSGIKLLLETKEDKSNKVAVINEYSTDEQYPTAKCVYELVGNVESILEALDIGDGVYTGGEFE